MAGRVIIIEGLDGVGKSTQVELLKTRYEAMGGKVYVHHFPTYGVPQARGVEQFLAGELKPLTPVDIATLYIHDFVVTWNESLKKYYDEDYILIFDRFWPSTVIYQGAMALDDQYETSYDIYRWLRYTTLPISEAKVIYMTGKFDTICEQKEKFLKEKGCEPDEIEKKTNLLKKIGTHATWCINEFGWSKVNVTREGKMRSIGDISDEIFEKSLT